MFCTNCGHEQTDNAKFCHNCGRPITIVAVSGTQEKIEARPMVEQTKGTSLYFYAVSPSKFAIMTVTTFGLYPIFWFAKNFILIKEQEKSQIWPIARAIFGIFFYSELARKALISAKKNSYGGIYDPTTLAILFFLTNIIYRAPDPWWLLGFISILTLNPTVKAMLHNNEKMRAKINTNYSTGDIVALIVGGMFWFFVLLGMLSP
jgi:hypothetical protein